MSDILNFFWPSTVYQCDGSHYINRPWFKNEFANHFSIRLFCEIERAESIDRQKYLKMDDRIECIDFFTKTTPSHLLLNYSKYKYEIEKTTDTAEDKYFVMYPYKKTSILLTHMLSDFDLTVWVKSDYVGLFTVYDDPPLKSKIKTLLKPLLSFAYPRITERLLQDNLIFYTGDIIYDTENHRTQYGITSLPPLNKDESRIRESIEYDVVFVGDEGNQKGLQYLLNALVKTDLDLELTIIGIDQLDRYREYHKKIDIETVGTIYDRERFFDQLADNDVLVMPSRCERQGKVQIEAMSAGVVPICTDSGGTYTTMDNLYNGMLFKEANVDDLVDCLETLYRSPTMYRSLQKNGLKSTEELDLSDQVNKMATIIKHYYT